MIITKKILAEKILDYLHHKISVTQLIDWSEDALMESKFDEKESDLIRNITGRLGLADVRAFGLMWVDCEKYLNLLGYKVDFKAEII